MYDRVVHSKNAHNGNLVTMVTMITMITTITMITMIIYSGCEVSDCGTLLLVYISKGCEPVHKLWVHELPDMGLPQQFNFTRIADHFDGEYNVSFIIVYFSTFVTS